MTAATIYMSLLGAAGTRERRDREHAAHGASWCDALTRRRRRERGVQRPALSRGGARARSARRTGARGARRARHRRRARSRRRSIPSSATRCWSARPRPSPTPTSSAYQRALVTCSPCRTLCAAPPKRDPPWRTATARALDIRAQQAGAARAEPDSAGRQMPGGRRIAGDSGASASRARRPRFPRCRSCRRCAISRACRSSISPSTRISIRWARAP